MSFSLDKEELEQHISTRAIMENITEAAVITDQAGNVLHYNNRFSERLSGGLIDTALPQFADVISRQGSVSEILQRASQKSGLIPFRICLRTQARSDPVSPAYASMLQSRLTGKPMAVLVQLDEQLSRFTARLRDIAEQKRSQGAMLRKARLESTTDPLTGLNNRRFIASYLELYWHNYQRSSDDCTVIFIDLDHFKKINDQYGHDAGDLVLKRFAELMRHAARDGDALGRWGGEEFIAVLPQCTVDQSAIFLTRLQNILKGQIFNRDRAPFSVSFSAGAASLSQSRSVEDAIRLADNAVYSAKEGGRNRFVIHRKDILWG